MTEAEEIEIENCRRLLDDPFLQRLFTAQVDLCTEALLKETEATPEADAKRRELIDRANTIRNVMAYFKMKVNVGKQAARPRSGIV